MQDQEDQQDQHTEDIDPKARVFVSHEKCLSESQNRVRASRVSRTRTTSRTKTSTELDPKATRFAKCDSAETLQKVKVRGNWTWFFGSRATSRKTSFYFQVAEKSASAFLQFFFFFFALPDNVEVIF